MWSDLLIIKDDENKIAYLANFSILDLMKNKS